MTFVTHTNFAIMDCIDLEGLASGNIGTVPERDAFGDEDRRRRLLCRE
jgi:hypothetical protein